MHMPHPSNIRHERVERVFAALVDTVIFGARLDTVGTVTASQTAPRPIGEWAIRLIGTESVLRGKPTGVRRMHTIKGVFDLDDHDVNDLIDRCAADGWTLAWVETGGQTWKAVDGTALRSGPCWTLVHAALGKITDTKL